MHSSVGWIFHAFVYIHSVVVYTHGGTKVLSQRPFSLYSNEKLALRARTRNERLVEESNKVLKSPWRRKIKKDHERNDVIAAGDVRGHLKRSSTEREQLEPSKTNNGTGVINSKRQYIYGAPSLFPASALASPHYANYRRADIHRGKRSVLLLLFTCNALALFTRHFGKHLKIS